MKLKQMKFKWRTGIKLDKTVEQETEDNEKAHNWSQKVRAPLKRNRQGDMEIDYALSS